MKVQDKIYHQILDHVMHLLGHKLPVVMIAGSLMAIAQRLYKTHLTPKQYKKIMKIAGQIHVEPYDLKKKTLH
jgi:hypothetical protein|tara:strand:- start:1149 stop:1367 length:219 start_codon:yes stop_codon:yes gene_type:complete